MSLHIIVYSKKYTTDINFIPNALPSILPKHNEIITYNVNDVFKYLFYLKQYLFVHSNMVKHGSMYCCDENVGHNMETFYNRWSVIGYDPNLSYYKNLMYLLFDRYPPQHDENMYDLSNFNINILRDCIVDFLEPKDIFKICIANKEYYGLLYERLITMKKGDLRGDYYSNGYMTDRIEIYLSHLELLHNLIKVNDINMYVSEAVPYPIDPNVNTESLRYLCAINSGDGYTPYTIECALYGKWTDKTRTWVKELHVPDVMGRPSKLYSNPYCNDVDGMSCMLTIDGDIITGSNMLQTPHGIFKLSNNGISTYSGSSIYNIHAYRHSIHSKPEHLSDYRGNEPSIEGKDLGNNRWLMGDPKETFAYILTYDDECNVIGLEIVHNDPVVEKQYPYYPLEYIQPSQFFNQHN